MAKRLTTPRGSSPAHSRVAEPCWSPGREKSCWAPPRRFLLDQPSEHFAATGSARLGGQRSARRASRWRDPRPNYGGQIWIVATVVSTVTLGTLFSKSGVALSATFLAVLCQPDVLGDARRTRRVWRNDWRTLPTETIGGSSQRGTPKIIVVKLLRRIAGAGVEWIGLHALPFCDEGSVTMYHADSLLP